MSYHLNIEIKAKSSKINFIRNYLKDNAADYRGLDFQKDTYFETSKGRLKLREGNIENSLIYYERPDIKGPKQSDVNLVKVSPNSGMKELLEKFHSVKVIVDKKREIYFIDNIKFHLDSVQGLGEFVEIEAIDADGSIGKEKLQRQCDYFIQQFQINPEDFVNCSYSDLLLNQ